MEVSGLGLVWNTIPKIPWNGWGKPQTRSVRAEIRTGNLQNINHMSCLLSQLPRWHIVVFMIATTATAAVMMMIRMMMTTTMMMIMRWWWHVCSIQAEHVIVGPSDYGMARSSDCGWIWICIKRAAATILNNQILTADKGWSAAWELVEVLTTPRCKTYHLTNHLRRRRNWTNPLVQRKQWKRNMRSNNNFACCFVWV